MDAKRDPRPRPRRARGRAPRRRIPWRVLGLAILVATAALAILATRAPAPALGDVTPEHNVHEFGTVRMQGGLLAASFPLAVDGEVDAVDLTTT